MRYVVVNGPFIAFEVVPGALSVFEVHAGQPKDGAAGRLQVVPDRLAIRAEKFVAGDLHVHRALVHEAKARSIGANRPDAIVEVPGAFVTKHDEVRICVRTLQVVGQIVLGVDFSVLSGLDVDGVDANGDAGGPTRLEPLLTRASGRGRSRNGFSFGIFSGANEKGLVGVDRHRAGSELSGDFGDFLGRMRIQIGGENRSILDVVDLPGLVSGHQYANPAFHDLVDGPRLQVDRGETGRCADDQLSSIRRVSVLVKI